MKTIHLLLGGMLAVLFFTGCSTHTAPKTQTVTVIRVKGQARYFIDGKPWQPVKKGDVLHTGVTIQTAPRSFVDIEFDWKPTYSQPYNPSYSFSPYDAAPHEKCLRVFENSSVTIRRAVCEEHFTWTQWTDKNSRQVTWLTLNSGQIMGVNTLCSADSEYRVSFPKGFATVSPNSIFMVSSSGVVNVLTGAASVYLSDKNLTYEVPRRNSFDPETGVVSFLTIGHPNIGFGYRTPTSQPPFRRVGMGGSLRMF